MSVETRRPGVAIKQVQTLSFSQQFNRAIESDDWASALGYGVRFGAFYDQEQNMVGVTTNLELLIAGEEESDESDRDQLGSLETLVVFRLVEDDGIDKSAPISSDFVANIIGIAYSTTRGVLIGRLPWKELELFPPPAINPRHVAHELDLDWMETSAPE